MRIIKPLLLVSLILVVLTTTIYASQLDSKLDTLSKQIISHMAKNKTLMNKNHKVTLAVIEFPTIDGKSTLLGKSIAEQLTTKLYLTNKFEIIERGLLNKVLAELQLNTTSIIDQESAKKLGKILGVSAIISGTITELDKDIQLNARLIATETGVVFGVAAVEMKKDADIKKLLSQVSETPTPTRVVSSPDPTEQTPEVPLSSTAPVENSFLLEEAQTFITPIINAISGKKPNCQDDFSNPNSGWVTGKHYDQNHNNDGTFGYINGEYFVEVSNYYFPSTTMREASSSKLPVFSDFVAEIDWSFVSESNGGWQFKFRMDFGGEYILCINPNGGIGIGVLSHKNQETINRGLLNTSTSLVKEGSDLNHLQVIAKGPRVAVLINGEIAAFVTDPDYTNAVKKGEIRFLVENNGETPFRVQFDNLKIWDISKLNIPKT